MPVEKRGATVNAIRGTSQPKREEGREKGDKQKRRSTDDLRPEIVTLGAGIVTVKWGRRAYGIC